MIPKYECYRIMNRRVGVSLDISRKIQLSFVSLSPIG